MPNYRRARVPGATYFFTANLRDRTSDLLIRHVEHLREAVQVTRNRYPFHIDAWVVLPDHMHCLWTLPPGDADFAVRWKVLKSRFSRHLPVNEERTLANLRRRERGIWQRGYWEHLIRDEEDYRRHADYIHINPLKHGHVARVADWPYSTFHRAVRQGIYPQGWAGGASVPACQAMTANEVNVGRTALFCPPLAPARSRVRRTKTPLSALRAPSGCRAGSALLSAAGARPKPRPADKNTVPRPTGCTERTQPHPGTSAKPMPDQFIWAS